MLSSLFAYKWTDATRTRLAELVERGLTGKQIARALSIEFGISYSRNSVISAVARSGLKFKNKSRRPAVTSQRVTLGSTKVAAVPTMPKPGNYRDDVEFVPEPDPAGDVATGCRWLHGEPTDRVFCGAETFRSSSYCQHHFARAFDQPIDQDERKLKRLAKWLSRI